MITPQDFENVITNKMLSDIIKAKVWKSYPPAQADAICKAIDAGEHADHLDKIIREGNQMCADYWNQQLQSLMVLLQQGQR